MKLGVAIAGADFFNKLVPVQNVPKKRVRAPELGDEPDKKAAKTKAAPKKSGKAKAKAVAKANPFAETQSSIVQLEEDVAMGSGEGARPRRWLGDLLAALEKANSGPLPAYNFDSAHGRLVSSLISLALEFALTGKLVMGKKTFKEWSKAG